MYNKRVEKKRKTKRGKRKTKKAKRKEAKEQRKKQKETGEKKKEKKNTTTFFGCVVFLTNRVTLYSVAALFRNNTTRKKNYFSLDSSCVVAIYGLSPHCKTTQHTKIFLIARKKRLSWGREPLKR